LLKPSRSPDEARPQGQGVSGGQLNVGVISAGDYLLDQFDSATRSVGRRSAGRRTAVRIAPRKITIGMAAINSRKTSAAPDQGVVLNDFESNAALLTVCSRLLLTRCQL
jgi:hypothetical protein